MARATVTQLRLLGLAAQNTTIHLDDGEASTLTVRGLLRPLGDGTYTITDLGRTVLHTQRVSNLWTSQGLTWTRNDRDTLATYLPDGRAYTLTRTELTVLWHLRDPDGGLVCVLHGRSLRDVIGPASTYINDNRTR